MFKFNEVIVIKWHFYIVYLPVGNSIGWWDEKVVWDCCEKCLSVVIKLWVPRGSLHVSTCWQQITAPCVQWCPFSGQYWTVYWRGFNWIISATTQPHTNNIQSNNNTICFTAFYIPNYYCQAQGPKPKCQNILKYTNFDFPNNSRFDIDWWL